MYEEKRSRFTAAALTFDGRHIYIYIDYIDIHSIITSKQHGLRRGMSCEAQLLEASYDWTNILSKGEGQIDVILLDLSKAFDFVPYHRLIMKPYMYGITGMTHRWIKDFFENRSQMLMLTGS